MSSSSSSPYSMYTGGKSPPRRPIILPSAISPFSTSPSQLQEISALDDATLSLGVKSPQGTMRGRSVKEYEELLTTLRKDNFNLKLRIYFLEERMGSNNLMDRDSIIKENVDLQIEAKILQTNLDEKQLLVCQAAKALELEEEAHNKALAKKDEEIKSLSSQIETLSTQMQALSSHSLIKSAKSPRGGMDDSIMLYTEAFGLHENSSQMAELKRKICDLEAQLAEEREVTARLENEVQEVQCSNQRCLNLEEALVQRDDKIRSLVQDLEEKGQRSSSLNLRIRGLEEELTHRSNEMEYKTREVNQRDNCIHEQAIEIEELRRMLCEQQLNCEKEQRQVEILKSTVMSRNNTIAELETRLEKAKTVIRKMESKLEATSNEVKRYHDEVETLRRRSSKGSPNIDSVVDSISARAKSANVPPSSLHNSPSASPTAPGLGPLPASPVPSPQKMRSQAHNKLSSSLASNKSGSNKTSSSHSPISSPNKTPRSPPNFTENGTNMSDESRLSVNDKMKRLEQQNLELREQVRKLTELDEENRNTLKVAKSLISGQKRFEKEKAQLEEILKQKEDMIVKLTQKLAGSSAGDALESLQGSADFGASSGGDGSLALKDSASNKSLQDKISELNLTASPPKKDNERAAMSTSAAEELAEKYKELVMEMKQQIDVYVALMAEKDSLIQSLQLEIIAAGDTVNDRDSKIHDLGDEIDTLKKNIALAASNAEELHEELTENDHSGTEKQDVGSEKLPENLVKQVEEKDKEIERLEMDLRKKNADLQSVVNKELWEKNREIERMQNRYTTLLETKEIEIDGLHKELSGKKLELHLLMDKVLELDFRKRIEVHATNVGRLEINEHNINAILDSIKEDVQSLQRENQMVLCKLKQCSAQDVQGPANLAQLQSEYKDLKEEFEKSEKLRHETTDICSAMTSRLEELALFLDSLLKHKSVLGFLGHDQKSSLRQLVDQSLDLSKSLSISITMNPDQSLLQLSNISNILNNSKLNDFSFGDLSLTEDKLTEEAAAEKAVLKLEPAGATLVYNNYLTKSKSLNTSTDRDEVIAKLREQIETLKKEVEIRDVELGNHNVIASSTEPSEKCDPEPAPLQKKISSAKINLNSTSTTLKNAAYENSESESWSEPDRSVSQARIGLLDESLKGSVSSATSLNRSKNRYALSPDKSTESTEEDDADLLPGSKASLRRETRYILQALQEKISQLENTLKEKDNELLKSQCSYYELDNELKKERIQMEILRQCVCASEDRLKKVTAEKAKIEEVVTELEIVVKEMQTFKADMENTVMDSEKKVSELMQENVQVKERLQDLEAEKERMEETHAEELAHKLQEVDQKWTDILQKLEQEAEVRVKEVQDATNELKRVYERDWVRKSDVDKRLVEVEVIVHELEGLKNVVKTAEKKMAAMEENEENMKTKLQENEKAYREKVNSLRKEMDAATLATSEAILERTRVANEKMKLEQELRKFDLKETELVKQLNEFEVEFSATTHSYKNQLNNLEQQKSQLELRVSELESTNAELLNRLLRAQAEVAGANADSSWHHNHLGGIGGSSLPSSPNICVPACGGKVPLAPLCVYKRQCSDLSGYTSDEIVLDDVGNTLWPNNASHPASDGAVAEDQPGRHVVNSSPDLGIESDQGRFSSLEATVNNASRPLLQTLELTQSMTNLLAVTNKNLDITRANNEDCNNTNHKVLEDENVDLKKRLLRTRRALEETVSQLALANQRKKLVERAVCKQIHKTSQVLRKAKANLDSGSETDHLKK